MLSFDSTKRWTTLWLAAGCALAIGCSKSSDSPTPGEPKRAAASPVKTQTPTPAEAKPAEAKPAEAKLAEAKPAVAKVQPTPATPEAVKPTPSVENAKRVANKGTRPAEPKPADLPKPTNRATAETAEATKPAAPPAPVAKVVDTGARSAKVAPPKTPATQTKESLGPPTMRLVHSANLQGELEPCG